MKQLHYDTYHQFDLPEIGKRDQIDFLFLRLCLYHLEKILYNYFKYKYLNKSKYNSVSFKNYTKLLPNHDITQKSIVDCNTQYLFSKMSQMKATTHW